jgi:protease I
MAKILMVVAPENYRDEELFIPKEIFEKKGHEVSVASSKTGTLSGVRGGSITAELLLSDVNTAVYDAVVFVGGAGCKVLFNNQQAIRIAQEMNEQQKIVAAICIAPVILANAGLLKNKKATVFSSEARAIKSKGAKYTEQGVTVDGNIITGDGPQSAAKFAEEISKFL